MPAVFWLSHPARFGMRTNVKTGDSMMTRAKSSNNSASTLKCADVTPYKAQAQYGRDVHAYGQGVKPYMDTNEHRRQPVQNQ